MSATHGMEYLLESLYAIKREVKGIALAQITCGFHFSSS